MTTFDEREEGFERKFALEEEQKFKAESRRNRLTGLWVAEQLGLNGEAATAYAKEVAAAGFERADGVVRKAAADLAARGMVVSEQKIRQKMDALLVEAIAQVKAGV
jgi:hypothetical protein